MLKKILQLFRKKQSLLPLYISDWVMLIAGLVVFAAISLWTITNSSVWFDEAFGAYLIRFDFAEIARYTAADVHPPFYYWLLKLWSMVFGTSDFAMRSMSVLFGAIAIFFAFLMTKRMLGRRAAWVGLLFMVLAPMFLRYSQEMRMYTLVAAIAFAATYTLTIAIERSKRKYWIVYGLLIALGMWTHYFAALVWLSHWIWRSWVVASETKNTKKCIKTFFSKDWILAHVVAIVFFLPWLPSLLRQVLDVQTHGFWIPAVSPLTLPNFFTNVLYYQDSDMVNPWATLVLVVIGVTMIALGVRVYRRIDTLTRQNYLLIGAVAFLPLALLIVSSMPPLRSSFIERYLIPSTLGISLFIGVTLALSVRFTKTIWVKVAGILVVGAFAFGIYNLVQLGNYNRNTHSSNNTRQVIEALSSKATAGEPIIADSPWLFYEAVFYSSAGHPVYFIDAKTQYLYGSLDMLKYNDQHKIKNLDTFADQHPKIWYLGRPGNNELTAPDPDWKALQQVRIDDSVSRQPAYQAIQYQTQ